MFATPQTQLFKNQYDALYVDTKDNPYLPASSRASKNKALKTSDKKIIGAINENKASVDALNATTLTTIASMNNKIGNLDGDANLNAAFQATGYPNIAQGIIGLHEKATSNTKNVYFVFPKIISTTSFPELYIPFDMKVVAISARYSELDNNITDIDTDIMIELQHTIKESPTTFNAVESVTIPVGSSYNFNNDLNINLNAGILKAVVSGYPGIGLKNLNVVVSLKDPSAKV